MKNFAYDQIFYSRKDLEDNLSKWKNAGYSLVQFSMKLGGKKEIFEFAKNNFLMDPNLNQANNWDALSDSIGGGMELIKSHGVIVSIDDAPIHEIENATEILEFIDILFKIRRDQSLENMIIYLYRCARNNDASVS